MKAVWWLGGAAAFFFVLSLFFGSNSGTRSSAAGDYADRVEAQCKDMLDNSAPGGERQMTKEVCDRWKAEASARR